MNVETTLFSSRDNYLLYSLNNFLFLNFQFSQKSQCVDFAMEQVAQVEGRKPASVKIYDYYDKGELGIINY